MDSELILVPPFTFEVNGIDYRIVSRDGRPVAQYCIHVRSGNGRGPLVPRWFDGSGGHDDKECDAMVAVYVATTRGIR